MLGDLLSFSASGRLSSHTWQSRVLRVDTADASLA
jgi:hypothetical protein